MTASVSLYPHVKKVKSEKTIPIDIFLSNVQSGTWQDIVLKVRTIKDNKERSRAKQKVPAVTISGIFPERKDAGLQMHSGLIGMDLDDLNENVETVRNILSEDPYVFAAFTSISGNGLCVIFKIDPGHHRDAFAGISSYLIEKYQLLAANDTTSVNPSRARFVSFDPDLFKNEKALTFKKYLPKEQKRKAAPVIFVHEEFERVVNEMVSRNVSCVDDYRDWLKISFGLADHFGESGRDYFHKLSACSHKYDSDMCDRQYNIAVSRIGAEPGGKKVTVSTVYYFAKEAGIAVHSETTRKVAAVASNMRKSGLDKETIIKNLEKFENIPAEQSRDIVEQAFNSNADYTEDSDLVSDVLTFIKHKYTLRFNEVTCKVENNGKYVKDRTLNTMFLEARKVFEKLTFDLFKKCLFSENVVSYNPFLEWWEQNKDYPYNDEIKKMWACFKTDNDDKLIDFGTRWLVSIIASINGIVSPLDLVLCGEVHGTGKTRFFRTLLPPSWLSPVSYYAESKLDGGKDDDILTTQKLLIMDDEFDGKSKVEKRRLKALTDKDIISTRAPYGYVSEDLKRLCVHCGTSQTLDILNDPTGNRRIIPIEVVEFDWVTCSKIDRNAIFAELFRMYHNGFKWEVLREDMERLNITTSAFVDHSIEFDLINKYYELPSGLSYNEFTITDIKQHIEAISGQKLNKNRIGQELNFIGFSRQLKRVNGKPTLIYRAAQKTPTLSNNSTAGLMPWDMPGATEDLPF